MEIEISKQETLPSFKFKSNSSINCDTDVDDPKYTSLKDILSNSPTHNASNHEGNYFDSSNITIRNQLVKHAASAYLQSAAILASRNQNCIVGLWGKLKGKAAWRSCWHVYVRRPLRACFRPICRFLAYIMNGIGNVWSMRFAIE